jgi:hypothetical protein
MKNKRQYYVPRSYLKAWCDPETPKSQTPYVWMFSKDRADSRKKSPEKIFCETDFYTIQTEDGKRDLSLEHNLSWLEGEFTKLRKNKLDRRLQLSLREELLLCTFVAAMYGRTKAHKVHWSQQLQKVLDLGEHMQRSIDAASPEERIRMTNALSNGGVDGENSITLEALRKMVDQPIQQSLLSVVMEITPLLFKIPFLILYAPKNLEFLTSDTPCVWFEPTGAGGLSSPDIEITLPLSPRQMLLFGKKLIARGIYIPFQDKAVIENLNKRTRLNAHEHFVFNRNKPRAEWF